VGKICLLRSRDTAHAQWLQTHCQPYPTGDVRTHNSRTDSRRIYKLGECFDHVTTPLTDVKRSKVKVTSPRNVSAAIMLYATDGRINFKLGENFYREVRNT